MAVLACTSLIACTSGRTAKTSHTKNQIARIDHSPESQWRPKQKHTIPVTMNDRVQRWVKAFNGPLRKNFTRWIWRIGLYGPTLERILVQEGAPADLIYLSMIESGFNMTALSHASAAGPWQFIQSTGRMYGLNRDFFVDQRSDFFKATRAAARHLKDLYKIYGDWYLAFAAYNAGPGRVNSAIRRGGTKDFWKLSSPRSRLFMQETKDYVPKILAALHIVKNYHKYGYSERSFGKPLAYERVSVPDATDISVIAKSAGTSTDVIKTLNPALNVGITPPGQRFSVYIPKGAANEFNSRFNRIPASQRVSALTYRTGRGESLDSISRNYGISLASLKKMNHHPSGRALKPGTTVKVPATKGALASLARTGYARSSSTTSARVQYYRIRRGDTLSRIAARHRVSTSKLAQWNRISVRKALVAGQTLKIHKGGRVTQYASSGRFIPASGGGLALLGGEPKSSQRLSGVAHIIMQESESGSGQPTYQFIESSDINGEGTVEPNQDATPSSDELPFVIAVATESSDETLTDENRPALIKTLDGEVSDIIAEEAKAQEKQNKLSQIQNQKVAARYYTVRSGDTLMSIAKKHHVTVNQLKTFNNLKTGVIRVRQKLAVSLPRTTKQIRQDAPLAPKTSNQVYVVKVGDTLSKIAAQHGVTTKSLQQMNGLSNGNIRPGQKLKVNKTSSPRPQTAQQTTKNKNKVILHRVKKGETLWSVSKRYGVKVSDLKKWNNLKSNQVNLSQSLKIIDG